MQETWQAIDAAPDVVIALMILAGIAGALVVGPLAFVAGLEWGEDRRRRLAEINEELVDDNARLICETWRLNRELDSAAGRVMKGVHERLASTN